MPTELEIKQWEHYEGDDWWKWAVWVEGAALEQVDYVEWTLHPTFKNPVRKAKNRAEKFRIETGGWGVFPIHANVYMNNGNILRLQHDLSLHYPDGKQNTD